MTKFITIFSLLIIVLSTTASAKTFSLMTYNLENLFDTEHDQGKQDWTYLPLSVKENSPEVQAYCATQKPYYQNSCYNLDWSNATLTRKVLNLAKAIKNYDNGKGADILVFQEVENIKALQKLAYTGLAGMGYRSIVLMEGPDKRGIDCGIISRFPVVSKRLHKVNMSGVTDSGRPTRSILQVTFDMGRKNVTVFANHWPSQGNIDAARLKAAKVLYAAASKVDGAIIATGDFNTLHDDMPHGINQIILNDNQEMFFYDSEVETQAPTHGTHWYKGTWSTLDKIFVTNESLSYMTPIWDSYTINMPSFVFGNYDWIDYATGEITVYPDVPLRFNPKTGKGYSDHLGVAMKFRI